MSTTGFIELPSAHGGTVLLAVDHIVSVYGGDTPTTRIRTRETDVLVAAPYHEVRRLLAAVAEAEQQ